MPDQSYKRRSRKRRPGSASAASASRARISPSAPARQRPRGAGPPGAFGERPASPFGGVPVSELAILAGGIGVVAGVIQGGGPALIVGVIVCALGVLEVTAREHFSGYRPHAALLAGIPAVGVETGIVLAFGEPRQRALLLVAVVPVYATLFWLLRRRFGVARQARVARVARMPAP